MNSENNNGKVEEDYLTPEEIAKKFKLRKTFLYRLARSGKIPCYRFGGRIIRFKASDVLAYASKQK